MGASDRARFSGEEKPFPKNKRLTSVWRKCSTLSSRSCHLEPWFRHKGQFIQLTSSCPLPNGINSGSGSLDTSGAYAFQFPNTIVSPVTSKTSHPYWITWKGWPNIVIFKCVHVCLCHSYPRVWNAVLGCSLKNDRMISVRFQSKPFNITAIQVYAPTTNAEEAEVERFYWRPTRPSGTNTPQKCPFHYRGLECKSWKPRDTWSNSQVWPWSTKWSRAKANKVGKTIRPFRYDLNQIPYDYTVEVTNRFKD